MVRMSRRDWALVLTTVIVTWGIDQVLKRWAVAELSSLVFYGPIGLVLHRNPGVILGVFSDLPALLRIVSLSTGGAFLIFLYGAFQYLLPKRSMPLRIGMSLLLGGILGNVTDRIIDGSVVDFIMIGTRFFSSPAFNFADAIQWVGYALVVVSLIREGGHIWPTENERKRVWILPQFQIKYILIMVFIGMGFSLIAGVFSYTYLLVTIDELAGGAKEYTEKRFLIPFLEVYCLISLSFCVTLFLIGRVLSHRTAGPLYAFELFLEDVLRGKDRPLKLRQGDEFHHLIELSEKVRAKLKANFTSEIDRQSPSEKNTDS